MTTEELTALDSEGELAIDVGESAAKGQSAISLSGNGSLLAEYIAPYIDERLFLSRYMLQLPSRETLTGFLKKENEGLPVLSGTKKTKGRKRVVGGGRSG